MIYFKYLTHIHLSYIWRRIEMKRILKVILVMLMVCSVCGSLYDHDDECINGIETREKFDPSK